MGNTLTDHSLLTSATITVTRCKTSRVYGPGDFCDTVDGDEYRVEVELVGKISADDSMEVVRVYVNGVREEPSWLSDEEQEQACDALAMAFGAEISADREESDVSGPVLAAAPEMLELLQAVANSAGIISDDLRIHDRVQTFLERLERQS